MRVVIESSQWIGLMLAVKAMAKTIIDDQYGEITEPSDALKQTLEKANANIDMVTESFTKSMKDVIDIMKGNKKDNQGQKILDAMKQQ